jgi:hypothetical protein
MIASLLILSRTIVTVPRYGVVEQSNISKTDIETMLVLFQDSVESIEKVEDSS